MTDNHPITPPPELRRLWAQQAQRMDPNDPVAWMQHVSTQAARWGADQELEACVDWMREARNHGFGYDHGAILAGKLRADRLPKPPSLKEQALKALTKIEDNEATYLDSSVIRRALEQLDD